MGRYFKNIGRNFSRLSDKCDPQTNCCIYVVKSVYDKQTTESYDEKKWERYIQVGCTLTDERLAECTEYDNIGDNISNLNRQFCELTGLYWIWKNSKEDIVGLEHYRRHFTLEDDWFDKMLERNIDVILPVLLYVHPSIAENYRGRHEKKVWDAMMSVLRRQPEVYDSAMDFFENTGCYSPCNMIIARRDVLNDLCEWLFPIVFEVAGRIGQIDNIYQNRYPGFLSERLITFFFYHNANKYKVVYADKNFSQ
ncbi:DUF4422 domain-containing protein [Oribacterium sp. P6A1]|uniref:DUF4422 domain-containing protein n=1 Tax=Oribacterium sp. P6A1 TaxID=1410612 RepID=UPI0005672B24|nr:DUF4422 domain-containing protein [Oribacterium sp. P6A1]